MNNYLEKTIRIKLLKMGDLPLTPEDYKNITELGVNNLTFSNKCKNIDLSELVEFSNIENLTLQHFEINDLELELLQQLKKLKHLSLVSCKLHSKQVHIFDSLESLSLNSTIFNNLSAIQCPKQLIIDGVKGKVDIRSLQGKNNITSLSLTNIDKVEGIKVTNEMSNLANLNLDGSKVDDQHVVDELDVRINVSQEKESRMIR